MNVTNAENEFDKIMEDQYYGKHEQNKSYHRYQHKTFLFPRLGACFHQWGAEKYSVSVLIPKDDTETVNAVNKAIDAAIEEGCCKIRR